MKISVVIPNFSDPRIDRALMSVRCQTYRDVEVVVVHGGPLPDSLADIYADRHVDRLIIEPDRGIFDALNKGLAVATGDIIYLMGADDALSDEEVFSSVIDTFRREPEADGVCIGCVFVTSRGQIVRKWFPRQVSAARMKQGFLPPHFSLFLRRELYTLVGPFKFEETRNIATDTVWLMDVAMQKSDVQIPTLRKHHLAMEYGGASTGSWRSVWRQFVTVHRYAVKHKERLSWWPFFSLFRTGSKVGQFHLSSRPR